MPTTDFGALSTARKKVWATQIWIAGRDANFWMSNGFVGAGTNNVIERITQLTRTERGDECIMMLVADLQSDGVVGDNELSGNEEPLFNDSVSIHIDQIRHGVRSKGAMSEQRTVIRFRSTAREKLAFWLADKIDQMVFLMASGVTFAYNNDGSLRSSSSQLTQLAFAGDVTVPSSGRQKFANLATSTASLASTDTLAWHMIVSTQAYAKRKRMKPIRSGGREWYGMVLSTEQCRDLKNDPTYQTITRSAAPRGNDNPLFRNALAVIDGVVLYEHNKVQTTLGLASGSKWGAAGTVDGAQALFLGAQAMGFATINDIEYEEADVNDYKNRPGIAVSRIIGMIKPQYTSIPDANTKQDFGIVNLYTASAATI
jgi:N4-gp56 family major capsid protein